MGAASFVGRVGGLAVALGVGTAVATGQGLAWATPDSDSSSTSPTGSSTAEAQPSDVETVLEPTPEGGSSNPVSTPTQAEPTGTLAPVSGTPSNTASTSSGPVLGAPTTGAVTSTGGAQSGSQTPVSDLAEALQETESTLPEGAATLPTTPESEDAPTELDASVLDSETETATTFSRDSSQPSAFETSNVETSNTLSRVSVSNAAPASGTGDGLGDGLTQQVTGLGLDVHTTATATNLTRSSAATDETSPVTTLAATGAAPAPTLGPIATMVQGIVTGVLGVFGLAPAAAGTPVAPAQPTGLWALLAWARREIETGLASWFKAPSASSPVVPTEPANLALTTGEATTFLAAAAAVNPSPAFPVPGQQLSASTSFVNWVTGNFDVNNTMDRFGIHGTDIGVIWDNGMEDDPSTPDTNESQVLMAFGDTFGLRSAPGEHWRPNVLLRSADTDLSDGMYVPDGEWFNGNMFGGSPLWPNPLPGVYDNYARQSIFADGLPAGITLIPTAGISVETPGTQFGVTQYVNFMSVTQWGAPGQWTTNYSALAYSTDNGENWTVAPQTVRYNQWWTGNQNFQQGAFVRPGDGYVYSYGTPNGRGGSAYVARVLEEDILDLTQYEYYSKGSPGGWFGWGATPAGWIKNNPAAASAVIGSTGACGGVSVGGTVSEMSVQYNDYLGKYVALYGDGFNNIVMRTADSPEGTWSAAKVLIAQQPGGIYAPMMHPWSPSTTGDGTDLYWNLSHWGEYNVMLLRTDLTKVLA